MQNHQISRPAKQIAEKWQPFVNRKTRFRIHCTGHGNDDAMGDGVRAMDLREKQLTEGRRDAGTRPPWASRPPPPLSRASRRLCTPSLASSALRSSRTGTPAAFLGSCPLDDGELRHGGSHASHTASNKGRRRRRGHLTEHVPRRAMLFVSLRSRDSARWHWQGPRGAACSRRWSACGDRPAPGVSSPLVERFDRGQQRRRGNISTEGHAPQSLID